LANSLTGIRSPLRSQLSAYQDSAGQTVIETQGTKLNFAPFTSRNTTISRREGSILA